MPGFQPSSIDSTIPTIDGNDIAHFDLTITLTGTPPPGQTVSVTCIPPGAITLNSPYTFSSSTRTLSLVSAQAITQQTTVTIRIFADNHALCRQVPIYPAGQTSPDGTTLNCT